MIVKIITSCTIVATRDRRYSTLEYNGPSGVSRQHYNCNLASIMCTNEEARNKSRREKCHFQTNEQLSSYTLSWKFRWNCSATFVFMLCCCVTHQTVLARPPDWSNAEKINVDEAAVTKAYPEWPAATPNKTKEERVERALDSDRRIIFNKK